MPVPIIKTLASVDAAPRADGSQPAAGQGQAVTLPRAAAPAEIGGPDGPEPTRYGDWERRGRCIDF